MKRARFSETQIVNILKEAEAGVEVAELWRQYCFSRSAFYKWKAKYGGLDVNQLKRLKELEKDKVIDRKVYANERPIRVSYSLTKMGYGMFYLLLPMLVYTQSFLVNKKVPF